jgi:hypothetical protein
MHLGRPSPAHTDGGLFNEWLTDFDYKVFPATIRVLMPTKQYEEAVAGSM